MFFELPTKFMNATEPAGILNLGNVLVLVQLIVRSNIGQKCT